MPAPPPKDEKSKAPSTPSPEELDEHTSFSLVRFLVTMLLVSRPGLWQFTGFLFAMGGAREPSVLLSRRALMGGAFSLLVMNVVTYAMNDLKDVDVDAANPRKGGFSLSGAKASKSDLRLCLAISILLAVVLPPLITGDLLWSLAWSASGITANWVYNFGPQLSRVAFLDMVPPLGYLLTLPFSSKVLWGSVMLEPLFVAFMVLVVFRTQLWFQLMDLEADAETGKRTTAVAIGRPASSVGVAAILACEVACAGAWGCFAAQAYSGYSFCVFALELVRGTTGKSDVTMALMGIGGAAVVVPFWMCLAA